MKKSSVVVSTLILLMALLGCDRPRPTALEFDKIDVSQDPVQTPCAPEEAVSQNMKGGSFTLTRVAEYKVNGLVISKKYYSDDWDGLVSPVDLLIVWDKLTEREYGRHITFTHGGRWYHYKWKEGSPVDPAYIITHSSNNHIIPANRNIYRAIKQIKKKDRIVLEGCLVNLKGIFKGRPISWNTSLSRRDTGNGSCEIFHVSKVRIDTKVYE
jgi:hypothetical protein